MAGWSPCYGAVRRSSRVAGRRFPCHQPHNQPKSPPPTTRCCRHALAQCPAKDLTSSSSLTQPELAARVPPPQRDPAPRQHGLRNDFRDFRRLCRPLPAKRLSGDFHDDSARTAAAFDTLCSSRRIPRRGKTTTADRISASRAPSHCRRFHRRSCALASAAFPNPLRPLGAWPHRALRHDRALTCMRESGNADLPSVAERFEATTNSRRPHSIPCKH